MSKTRKPEFRYRGNGAYYFMVGVMVIWCALMVDLYLRG